MPEIRGGWTHTHADDGFVWSHPVGAKCEKLSLGDEVAPKGADPVSLPPHYRHLPVECIDVAENFSYCLGNVIKYVWRHEHKGKPLEDLRKARYYLDRAIKNLEKEQGNG